MARLPTNQRLRREEFPEAPSWIERLIIPLNLFIEAVYSALNRNLTLQDNLACQIKELTFTTPADYDSGGFPVVSFSRTLPSRVIGLVVLQLLENSDNFTAIKNGVFVDWRDLNTTITLAYVSGLQPSRSYSIRLVLF